MSSISGTGPGSGTQAIPGYFPTPQRTAKLRVVGQLTPFDKAAGSPLRVESTELTIGRDPAVSAVLPHESVSRRHARIYRRGHVFLLEDLGSSNGTFVGGIPVVACPLYDGDTVQFGQQLYYFEHVLEPVEGTKGGNG